MYHKIIKNLIANFNEFTKWVQTRFFMMNEAFSIDINEHNKRLKALEDLAGITYVAPTDEEVNKMVQDKLKALADVSKQDVDGTGEPITEEPALASMTSNVDNVTDKVDNEPVVESKVRYHKEF